MNQLALRSDGGVPARRAGNGAAMQTVNGGVSAVFALEAFDPRLGMAIYSLQVMNYTTRTLACRVWAIAASGKATLAYPVLVNVPPDSSLETEIPVLPATLPRFQRALVEVAGEGVHCLVEAPAPVAPPPQRSDRYAPVAAAFLAGMTLLGTVAGIRSATPRIEALALPPQTLVGTTVRAEYAAGGSGTLSYSVVAPDGSTLQGGTLPARAGSIPIAIPAATQTGAYTVEMVMNGPFGRVNETRVLNTLIDKPRAAAIENIAVHPVSARAGQTVNVSYSATGDGGYVRLVGGNGTIWGQHPFSRRGQTSFVVPPVAAGAQLQVHLHVTKGNSTAQSVAGLVVAGSPHGPVSAGPSVQLVGSDDPNAVPGATSNDSNGTFDVLNKTVNSGGAIAVKILSPRNGMRVSLMDTQSHEISGLDVGADATVITLHAPSVQVPTRYVVEASFTDGFGQETVVQSVTVNP